MTSQPTEIRELVEVHCRGCRQLVGVAPADYRIFCNEICAADFPASSTEQRDALIETIYQTRRVVPRVLGEWFGISRQRVNQILEDRSIA